MTNNDTIASEPCADLASRIQALEAELKQLRAAAILVVDYLPWHEPDHPDHEGELSDIGRHLRMVLWPKTFSNCAPHKVNHENITARDGYEKSLGVRHVCLGK